jgi:predicted Zn-dependent peptidase
LLTPQEKLAKIMKVTQNDVIKVARDILASHKLRLALIGPFKNTKPFEKILRSA